MIQTKFENICLTFLELVNSTNVLIILEHFGPFQGQNKVKILLFKLRFRTYLVLLLNQQVLHTFKTIF